MGNLRMRAEAIEKLAECELTCGDEYHESNGSSRAIREPELQAWARARTTTQQGMTVRVGVQRPENVLGLLLRDGSAARTPWRFVPCSRGLRVGCFRVLPATP